MPGGERLKPYQSEDHSLTIPTHRKKENKGKNRRGQKGSQQLRSKKNISPALKTHQSHTIEYRVSMNNRDTERAIKVLRYTHREVFSCIYH